ncbi:MAG: hypothetical protein ACRDPH_11465 [Marmoricola sp.]
MTIPLQVKRGDNPTVPWVDNHANVLHVGKRRIGLPTAGYVYSFRRVGARRFVVQDNIWHDFDVTQQRLYVVGVGKPRLLTKHMSGGYQVSVRPRGQVAYGLYRVHARPHQVIRVQRVDNGKVVGQRGSGSGPLAFRDGKVWLDKGGKLQVWNRHSGRVYRTGHPAAAAVDLVHGFAVRRHGQVRMTFFPLRTGAPWKAWTTPENSGLYAWSPDGNLVATWRFGGDDGQFVGSVQMRNARTGHVVRSFRPAGQAYFVARWETSKRLLVSADGQKKIHLLRLRPNGSYRAASGEGGYEFGGLGYVPGWTANGPGA